MKRCSRCKKEKPASCFRKNQRLSDGLHSWCKDCCKEYEREWRSKNPREDREYKVEWGRSFRERHPEQARAKSRRWKKKTAYSARYRATRLQRTPKWAELDRIAKFYNNRPEGHHVDHIIPLQGELVSGLHVLENLQYLPAEKNISKKNHYRAR